MADHYVSTVVPLRRTPGSFWFTDWRPGLPLPVLVTLVVAMIVDPSASPDRADMVAVSVVAGLLVLTLAAALACRPTIESGVLVHGMFRQHRLDLVDVEGLGLIRELPTKIPTSLIVFRLRSDARVVLTASGHLRERRRREWIEILEAEIVAVTLSSDVEHGPDDGGTRRLFQDPADWPSPRLFAEMDRRNQKWADRMRSGPTKEP